MMNVLRYANEVRDTEGLGLPPKSSKSAGVSPRELELAERLIDDMSGPWKPEQFKDTYHDDLMNRIEEKIKKGETKELTEPEKEKGGRKKAEVIDLMELLKQSIGKSGKKPAHAAEERAPAVRNGPRPNRIRVRARAKKRRSASERRMRRHGNDQPFCDRRAQCAAVSRRSCRQFFASEIPARRA
jgi:DNA end-binding protein Ku